jgi:hypothetical protein
MLGFSCVSDETREPQAGQSRNQQSSTVTADDSDWSETESSKPDGIVFQSDSAITVPLDENCTEYDCFSIFFDHDMMKKIRLETNRYAASRIATLRREGKLKRKSLWQRWTTVKLSDMYKFFAIVLHMSILKLPDISDYWSTDIFLATRFSKKLLSRDRFKGILFMLHLNDNANYVKRGQDGHDPIFKIRPFFDFFVKKCSESFRPFANLTIDEGICPFRGRVGFRIYMKNKPNKYGLKLYLLCDAATGFVLNCEIYTGSIGNKDNSVKGVVERLCTNYFGKGHCIFMDRFYTSPALLNFLWEKKTLAVGTVMKNRKGLPSVFKTKKLKKGEVIFRRKAHLLASKWKATRDVYSLSTKHAATTSSVQVRSRGGPTDVIKPDMITDYNMNKVGVDRADQLYSYYPFQRKTIKWWKKLFFHMFTMATINGYVLFKERTNKNISLRNFIKSVATKLAEMGGGLSEPRPRPPLMNVDRTVARHFATYVPPTANKTNATRYCKVCSDRGLKESGKRKRKESRFWCKDCEVGLCFPQCFIDYHTLTNYA